MRIDNSNKIQITLLGATGSIGASTLDVISQNLSRYQVYALTANTSVEKMLALCLKWQPRFAVMKNSEAANLLTEKLHQQSSTTDVLDGEEGLLKVVEADAVDCVVAAIVGAAGLVSTLASAKAGKRILLANKEALVMSGQLFIDTVKQNNATLLPVDSEHNAIFQSLPAALMKNDSSIKSTNTNNNAGIERILLTASGGPFRCFDEAKLQQVTPEQAVNHPNWAMGKKISVDSATLMNKGLELIEAHWLFDMPVDCIDVVVHPQSIIHSMVSYSDGSVLAELGNPDMRTPIAHALAWPQRIKSGVEPLNIFEVATLDFEKPDLEKFPCLALCYQAIKIGGSASIVLNAANEIAVDAFLNNKIKFTDIANVIEKSLADAKINAPIDTLENVIKEDKKARNIALQYI